MLTFEEDALDLNRITHYYNFDGKKTKLIVTGVEATRKLKKDLRAYLSYDSLADYYIDRGVYGELWGVYFIERDLSSEILSSFYSVSVDEFIKNENAIDAANFLILKAK